jgi:hypothetical protein
MYRIVVYLELPSQRESCELYHCVGTTPTFVDARAWIVNLEFNNIAFTRLRNWMRVNVFTRIAAQNNEVSYRSEIWFEIIDRLIVFVVELEREDLFRSRFSLGNERSKVIRFDLSRNIVFQRFSDSRESVRSSTRSAPSKVIHPWSCSLETHGRCRTRETCSSPQRFRRYPTLDANVQIDPTLSEQ